MKIKEKEKWRKSYKNIKNPPHWAVDMTPSKLLTRNFVNLLNKEKIRTGKILDIGCGNGRDSIYLAKAGYPAVGIDITPNAVLLAKRNGKKFLNKTRAKNLEFILANAEKLPFKDNYFDAVYSIGVLHSSDLKKSLRETARVLKKGGVGIIHLWEGTLTIKTGKIKTLASALKIKLILRNLPIKILSFRNKITTNKIDYDEGEKNAHKHYAIIFSFKKINKP